LLTHSTPIIRNIKNLSEIIIKKYGEKDQFMIGLRFGSVDIEKVETFPPNLLHDVWLLIDGKHLAFKEMKSKNFDSIFIQDKTGATLYDSSLSKVLKTSDRLDLKKDGNKRVLEFKYYTEKEKSDVVEITCQQIYYAPFVVDVPVITATKKRGRPKKVVEKPDDSGDEWDELLRNTLG